MTSPRELWRAFEPVHALCYFHPVFAEDLVEAGLTGWWNGYFAGRAAPLGAVGPAPVTALFFGFAPAMVERAVPKVWDRISPEDAVAARFRSAERVLGPWLDDVSDEVVDDLASAARRIRCDGRALAAAWQAVSEPRTRAARLWWATTVLREHRGDGHVASATAAGLDGLETTATLIAAGGMRRETIAPARGWTDEQWHAAADRLRSRGLLAADDTLTEQGRRVRDQVEDATDRLASQALSLLDDPDAALDALRAVTAHVVRSGVLPVPNPIGLVPQNV